MIKDKLKTISDEDAIAVATLLLKSSTSSLFNFTFEKIIRQEYIVQHGIDAEESVDIYFIAKVKNEDYKKSGWKDKKVRIQLVERDNYHNYPHFCAFYMEEADKVWKNHFLTNHIEAIEYLQSKGLI